MPTQREIIHRIAFEILEEGPDGVNWYNDLTGGVLAVDSSLKITTVRHNLLDLDKKYPELVWKPVPGVFQLLKYHRDGVLSDDGGVTRPKATELGPAAGGIQRTFIRQRDGTSVAVILPIEEYEELRAVRSGVGPPGPPLRPLRHELSGPQGWSDARILAEYIKSLPDFAFVAPPPPYRHMGATLTSCVLAPNLTYEPVVRKALKLRDDYPEATTTSGFARLIAHLGLAALVGRARAASLITLGEVTRVLNEAHVEIEDEARIWLSELRNRRLVGSISGIGDKTGEFMRVRCGETEAVALDRWMTRLVEEAGVSPRGFWHQHKVISDAARILGVSPATLGESIWTYMRTRPEQPA